MQSGACSRIFSCGFIGENFMKKTSRREFMQLSGAAVAGSALLARTPAVWASNSSASVAVEPPLSVFEYGQVQLLPGLFREQFDRTGEFADLLLT